MCEECGCALTYAPRSKPSEPLMEEISVQQSLFAANDAVAAHNRQLFARHGVLTLNLMSSPGSGKTALLEALIPQLSPALRCAVIVGDLATDNDARRLQASGAEAVQITTGQACHLDARMIADTLPRLDLAALDVLFIENVGNLVCPASFDLGERRRIALLSVCEGDDKPAKYPTLFHRADLMLITKADLLPLLPGFVPARAEACLRDLASKAPCITLSALQPASLAPLCRWISSQHAAQQNQWRAV